VPPAELPFEFMLNALRLSDGFPIALFEERTGLPFVTVVPQLENAERRGLVERDWQRVRPTERGRLFLNELLALFVGGENRDREAGVPIALHAPRTSSPAGT
jgi:oxygen-independent coproporphyrinogen-3 oxidase